MGSEIGYETKTKCKMFKDDKLKQLLIEVEKGELMGGKKQKEQSKTIQIIEPIQGFIESKYIQTFDITSANWKFKIHERSTTATSQSLTMRIHNDDLLLPPNDDDNEDEKKFEDNPTSYNDPVVIMKNSNVSL